MPEPKRLELVYRGMVRKFPRVVRDRVLWPWYMSTQERQIVEAESRPEFLNVELLDAVLSERTIRANEKRL